jgi:hypothetical protein
LANNSQIELGFDNPNETDEWFGAFASVIPVAQASLLLAQQQAALGSAAQGPPQLESSTIEGAIAIHAHYRTRVQFGRSVLLQEPPAEEISRAVLGPHQAAPHMVAVLNCVSKLKRGYQVGIVMVNDGIVRLYIALIKSVQSLHLSSSDVGVSKAVN